MSMHLGGTFRDSKVLAWGMACQIAAGGMDEDDTHAAVKMLDYLRRNLWIVYPRLCEAHFDQDANGKEQFSITLLPAETIAANLAAME